MVDVSIIIVNYNTSKLTLDCVDSIRTFTSGIAYEIIVVDNHSESQDLDRLKNCPYITLICNDQNFGFGYANNIGIEQSSGKYIFLLNSDTRLLSNIILEMFEFSESHFEMGAVGCLLLGENMQDIHSAGAFRSPVSMLGNFFCKLFCLPDYDKRLLRRIKNKAYLDVDYVTGADLFLKRSLFDEVGGFDPNFFMYNEDSDLQLRIKEMGLRRIIINSRSILHLCGASQRGKMTFQKYAIRQKSLKYYVRKNFTGMSYGLMSVTIFFSNIKNLLLLLKR